jgi:hypothetical protein
MEISVDPDGVVFALGSCGYSGGLSRLDPAPHVLAASAPLPARPAVCGERIAAGAGGLVAVARGPGLDDAGPPPGIVLIDGRTGLVRATVGTPSVPVDVVVG